jgi:16S rRNA (guanine966-N2)-methyltransferase
VTRIVAGFAGSLSLAVPHSGTRPTSDRVREAIFSALESRDALRGAEVLDLYAGSGALGLEAASRGAASVTLVEHNAAAAGVCKRNASAVLKSAPAGRAPRIDVRRASVHGYLEGAIGPFDLVFIDPPYDLPEAELARALGLLAPLLAADAIVLVERSTRSPEPAWPDRVAPDRSRAYGETTLWWAGAAVPA